VSKFDQKLVIALITMTFLIMSFISRDCINYLNKGPGSRNR